MTTRIETILLRARDTLADIDKQRWSEPRLIRLIDEAQKDIARHSKILSGVVEFPLVPGTYMYTLPEDLFIIKRAAFADTEIPFVTYDSMDEQARKVSNSRTGEHNRGYSANTSTRTTWQLDTANYIDSIIYDNRNMGEIRVYPIPDDGITENTYTFDNSGYLDPTIYATDSPYGIMSSVPTTDELVDILGIVTSAVAIDYHENGDVFESEVGFDSPYGLTAEIIDSVSSIGFHGDGLLGITVELDEYTFTSPEGVPTDLYDPEVEVEELSSVFGIITSASESDPAITLWYTRLPAEVTDVLDTLEIPSMYDTAIRLFVVGNAFLDDNDAGYRQKGQDTLNLYDRELSLAMTTHSVEGVRNPAALTTSYRGAFD